MYTTENITAPVISPNHQTQWYLQALPPKTTAGPKALAGLRPPAPIHFLNKKLTMAK